MMAYTPFFSQTSNGDLTPFLLYQEVNTSPSGCTRGVKYSCNLPVFDGQDQSG